MRGRISPPFSTVPPRFCDSDELPAYTTIPLYFPQRLFLQKQGTALLRSLSKILGNGAHSFPNTFCEVPVPGESRSETHLPTLSWGAAGSNPAPILPSTPLTEHLLCARRDGTVLFPGGDVLLTSGADFPPT